MQGIICMILMIGVKRDDKGIAVEVKGLRYVLLRVFTKILSRLVFFSICCMWYRPMRPKICYKKYLGEDWKPDYDGNCSTMVANHVCFLDPWAIGLQQ